MTAGRRSRGSRAGETEERRKGEEATLLDDGPVADAKRQLSGEIREKRDEVKGAEGREAVARALSSVCKTLALDRKKVTSYSLPATSLSSASVVLALLSLISPDTCLKAGCEASTGSKARGQFGDLSSRELRTRTKNKVTYPSAGTARSRS